MKRTNFILLVTLLTSVITLASCWNLCGCDPELPTRTLKEDLQDKTYKVMSVTKSNQDVTNDFKDNKIAFSADASNFSYITNSTHSSNCNINTNTITLFTPPTNWGNTLTEAKSDEYGIFFAFKVTITHPTTGAAEHHFKMQRQ